MVRIHAIETGTVAVKTRQRDGSRGSGMMRLMNTLFDSEWTDPLPILAWVVEHPEGVIIIDTGETSQVSDKGYFPWWHPYYRLGVKEWVEPYQEIGPQLEERGISPDDVRWVVMTHLHTDHAGGLYHFPKAEFIVSRKEYGAASGLSGQINGFLPQHWFTGFSPRLIDYEAEPIGSFSRSYRLTKADDIWLVPTEGHTSGHQSVIIRDSDLSYFIAGDLSYTQDHLIHQTVDGVSQDISIAKQSIKKALTYMQDNPTIYLPSHDPDSVHRLTHQEVIFHRENERVAV